MHGQSSVAFSIVSANQPGAVGIVQLTGVADEVLKLLGEFTARPGLAWEVGRLRLCDFAGIDEGLAGVVGDRDGVVTAQLMPHGGLRVVQKIATWLEQYGVSRAADVGEDADTRALYPEASSPIEADVLHAIAHAASPAAIDLLSAQPRLWRQWWQSPSRPDLLMTSALDHLLAPPTVVVVGRPNVGKSTLLNRLVGRSASVVADLPGTTRDWVSGLVELVPTGGDAMREGVAVRWLDTPGVRASDDGVEQRAIALAREMMVQADVLISMTRSGEDVLDRNEFPREPDFVVVNEFAPEARPEFSDALAINAATGYGLELLNDAVLGALGLSTFETEQPWAFSRRLRDWATQDDPDHAALAAYLGVE